MVASRLDYGGTNIANGRGGGRHTDGLLLLQDGTSVPNRSRKQYGRLCHVRKLFVFVLAILCRTIPENDENNCIIIICQESQEGVNSSRSIHSCAFCKTVLADGSESQVPFESTASLPRMIYHFMLSPQSINQSIDPPVISSSITSLIEHTLSCHAHKY